MCVEYVFEYCTDLHYLEYSAVLSTAITGYMQSS